jgi:protein O-GlcNAc transferase
MIDQQNLLDNAIRLHQSGRIQEALNLYDKILPWQRGNARLLFLVGTANLQIGQMEKGMELLRSSLAIYPNNPLPHDSIGLALHSAQKLDEALASYDRALAIKPDFAPAHNNRGNVLRDLRRPEVALASYDRALAINPKYAEAFCNRGTALRDLRRMNEALASYDKALAISPDNAEIYYNRGMALRDMGRLVQAVAHFDKTMSIDPGHRYAFGELADAALRLCDWTCTAGLAGEAGARIRSARSIIPALTMLCYSDDASLLLECARSSLLDEISSPKQPLWDGTVYRHDKIRIAYLSADFHEHATAWLIAELFEKHDRQRFSVTAISYGPDDNSPMRARLVKAFDQFIDASGQSDRQVALLLRDMEIDIAIDLKGHTDGGRPAILAFRPAPVSVSYLGFPGSMGATFIDYVIADAVVLPFAHQPFYDEHIVHLPHSYQPNDSKRIIAAATPGRDEVGLPVEGFVFCCFNNSRKITAPVFDIWMRLLTMVPGSVLWLLGDNEAAMANLKAAASERGIDPARLVFAPRTSLPAHLARHRLADLFLDTLPYNAHTTASDALWAGLPVLTCRGSTFAGRVAASLLYAIGMPELVTDSPQEYEELACKLARDPERLHSLRSTLQQNRFTHPLFDIDCFRRNIEKAYITMWEASERGDAPKAFAINPESLPRGASLGEV